MPFANAIIPQANEDAFGALKPYCYNETDENYPYDDYQQCYQVLSSGEQNGRLTTKKRVRSYYELTPDIILNSCFYADEGDFIANFRGASDEIKNLLGVQDVDFPILMYHKDTVYNSERPTYTLSVITQTGKHGTFTCKRSTGEMTPIAWTFEGGGKSTFDIVIKYDNSTNEYTPTQTWNEIKTALTKSDRYEDYALLVDGVYMGIERFYVSRNNNGEVDGLYVQAKNTYNFRDITDINNNNIVTTYTILSIDYEVHATKNKVTSKENFVAFQYNFQIVIDRDDTGALACHPKNAVAYLLSNAKNNASITAVSTEGSYSFEGAEADSNATGNMPNILYFSTTANGIYKRLKITQGQNGAADTVVMDKEIELAGSINNIMFRGVVASGTIYRDSSIDFRIENQDPYSKRAFQHLCNGTRNAYLKLYGANTSEYELEPGGFADGIYSLKYNGKDALKYNIKGANYGIGFAGDIYDIIKNDSKITGYELLADQFSYSVIPRNDIETDDTTIKFNEYGQLTLALSNANGVSF